MKTYQEIRGAGRVSLLRACHDVQISSCIFKLNLRIMVYLLFNLMDIYEEQLFYELYNIWDIY